MKRATCSLLLLVCAAIALVAAIAPLAAAQPRPPPGANSATLSLQFDNTRRSVASREKLNPISNTLARRVFLVPASQVQLVGGLDQSRLGGLFGAQSVVSFRATGPTTNGRSVLANCQANTSSRLLGLRSSVAASEIKRATDTWWPNDAVRVQKATCTSP